MIERVPPKISMIRKRTESSKENVGGPMYLSTWQKSVPARPAKAALRMKAESLVR